MNDGSWTYVKRNDVIFDIWQEQDMTYDNLSEGVRIM